jgi:hypothetical protein
VETLKATAQNLRLGPRIINAAGRQPPHIRSFQTDLFNPKTCHCADAKVKSFASARRVKDPPVTPQLQTFPIDVMSLRWTRGLALG